MRQLLFATSLLLMPLSTDRWLADFHQILDEISAHYANLDSAINDRRLNLPELRLRTEVQIRAARTDEDAKQAITTFLRAFGDGHVSLEWTSSERRETNPASLCGRLGYKQRDDLAGVDFSTLGDYKAMDEPEFPGGILTLRSGQKAGVIRIRLFSETEHPALCIAAQKALGIADDAACDQDCRVRVGRAGS